MMQRYAMLAAVVGLLGACGTQQEVAYKGSLYISVAGKQIQTQATVYFTSTTGGSSAKALDLIVGNQGDARLKIRDIRLEPNGNKYVALDPLFVTADFPKYITAGDIGGNTSIRAKVRYSPGATPDDNPTTLTIEYTDVNDGTFTLTVMPVKKAPQIKVTPDNYTFVGATASVPGYQDFVISNTGTDTLILQSLSFQDPTNAFTIINGPKAGTKIDPENTGMGNDSANFSVRYAPTNPPDENYIVIKSNDPLEPEKLIKLQGEMELGEALVAWVDQVTGCVDFTKQSTAGDTCTKVVNISNTGKGALTLSKPLIVPAGSAAYTFQWFHGGGSQAAMCGPYSGTEIDSTQTQYVLTAGSSVDVAVTYVADASAKGHNASLALKYTTPYPGTFEVPLCGGEPKGEFDVAPPAGNTLYFFSEAAQTKQKTFVIMNKGNGKLLIHKVTFVKANQTDPDNAFSVKTAVSEVSMEPFALLPVTVEFSTTSGFAEPILNGRVDISYQEPLNDWDQISSYNLVGHNQDFEGVVLPVTSGKAVPATAKKGTQLTLDASASTGGTYALWNQGFTWFVSAKPKDSQIFLNHADGTAQVSVTPDVAGTYEFRVYAFSTDGASAFYYSDEAVVTVQVTE